MPLAGARDHSAQDHGGQYHGGQHHGEGASLKRGALGFASALVIGLASTAPAYSLAAVIGLLAVAAGAQTPAVLLLGFLPMLFIAVAYYYMNRADQDPGTTFAWATRALGPTTGWLAGWAIMTAGVIVIGLLANTAATYTYLLFGADGLADSQAAVLPLAVVYVLLSTWVCVLGIELSARTQVALLGAQITILVLFAVVTLVRVLTGNGIEGSTTPELSWFSPFAAEDSSALVAGVLIAVFVYWGWDSAVSVNEETADSSSTPGRAALWSTVILVGVYVLLGTACVAWLGVEALSAFEDETAFDEIASGVFPAPLDKLVVLAVLTSALSSTQTTVLPSSRTALSMARHRAAPTVLAEVHPRYLTPHVATWVVGGLSVAFYVVFNLVSESFYADSLEALGLLICINYGLNGLTCVVYYRRQLTRSARNLLFMGLAPLVGFLLFAYVLVRSVRDSFAEDYANPVWVTLGLFALAAVLMVGVRARAGREFFARRRETAGEPVATR